VDEKNLPCLWAAMLPRANTFQQSSLPNLNQLVYLLPINGLARRGWKQIQKGEKQEEFWVTKPKKNWIGPDGPNALSCYERLLG